MAMRSDSNDTAMHIAMSTIGSAQLPARLPDDVQALKALLIGTSAQAERAHQAQRHAEQALHQAQQALQTAQQAAREELERTRRAYEQRIEKMLEEILKARRRFFGASSERETGQSALFDEAEALAQQPEPQEDAPSAEVQESSAAGGGAPRSKPRGKRTALPAELPRVDIVHEIPEDERLCACGTPMLEIGEEISEQLDIVPMKIQVLRHIRKRYACPDANHAPKTAALPPQPLPKSNASAGLLAMLLTTKYVDALPLARFEKVLARHGAQVPRQTLARWAIGSAERMQPLLNLARDELTSTDLMHMDETMVQVLRENGRRAQSQSVMWVQRGGPPGRPVVLYEYDTSHAREVALRLLEGFTGYLMTDGHEAYRDAIMPERIRNLGCWAHCRRGFVEAAAVLPRGKRGRAHEMVDLIRKLYRIEREATDAGLDHGQRHVLRQQSSVAQLQKIRRWLDTHRSGTPPQSALGRAMTYAENAWPRLVPYVERGDLPIDNNACENAIRPFVIGRKNWLFSDTPAGAKASAAIYSLIETAKANGVDPYLWISRVMREIPAASCLADYEALMPWNFHGQQWATTTAS